MKANEVRKKTNEELAKELDELKKELFKLRFQHTANPLENPMRIKQVKRNIAVIKTIIRERETEDISEK